MSKLLATLLLLPLSANAGNTFQTPTPNSFTTGVSISVAAPSKSFLPTTIQTPQGTYIVVPNASTGAPMAVIQTSVSK